MNGHSTVNSNQLPQDFAQNVLQLEMQMEFEEASTLKVVQQLNQLYIMAIEHYVDIQDQTKIYHFQRKLQTLLTNPRTLHAIENQPVHPEQHQNNNAEDYSNHLKNQINKFNSQSEVLIKSMVEGSDIRMERSSRLINQNIENQQEALRRRMESRGKSRAKANEMR